MMIFTILSENNVNVTSVSTTGKVFDFNATLPIMVSQLIILMVFLDKTWFGPVGDHLDLREQEMKRKISTISEKNRLTTQLLSTAKELIQKSRLEYRETVEQERLRNKALNVLIIQKEKEHYEQKKKLEIERMSEDLKEISPRRLHNTVYSLSKAIIRKVLPPGFKL
jgi:F-type H+-transporting ATPase subunit b